MPPLPKGRWRKAPEDYAAPYSIDRPIYSPAEEQQGLNAPSR
jgi:hypothetical protein